MESSSEEESITKSARPSRARAVRVSTRTRATRKNSEEEVVRREVAAPTPEIRKPEQLEDRKAPTQFSKLNAEQKRKRKILIIASTLFVIGVGASAAVGLTDSGQINVEETIEARNQRIRNNTPDENDVLNSTVEIPVQNTSPEPNGGLVGLGVGTKDPEPEVATSTATSSEENASSTEEAAEDVVEEASAEQ